MALKTRIDVHKKLERVYPYLAQHRTHKGVYAVIVGVYSTGYVTAVHVAAPPVQPNKPDRIWSLYTVEHVIEADYEPTADEIVIKNG